MTDSSEASKPIREGIIQRVDGRPLPIIVLADTSGSMQGEKIAALNEALRQMTESFGELDDRLVAPWISLITFDDSAMMALPPTPFRSLPTAKCMGRRSRPGLADGTTRSHTVPSTCKCR